MIGVLARDNRWIFRGAGSIFLGRALRHIGQTFNPWNALGDHDLALRRQGGRVVESADGQGDMAAIA